jgi:hypothetical protein
MDADMSEAVGPASASKSDLSFLVLKPSVREIEPKEHEAEGISQAVQLVDERPILDPHVLRILVAEHAFSVELVLGKPDRRQRGSEAIDSFSNRLTAIPM